MQTRIVIYNIIYHHLKAALSTILHEFPHKLLPWHVRTCVLHDCELLKVLVVDIDHAEHMYIQLYHSQILNRDTD